MRLYTVLMLSALAQPAMALTCDSPAPLPVRNAVLAPFSAEVQGLPGNLGASGGLLASARDESLAVDVVLLRLGRDACLASAAAANASSPGDAYAGYQKKTEHDNTPWRYEGKADKPFSAAEFDAWMQSRGIRIAKGKTEETAEAARTVGE